MFFLNILGPPELSVDGKSVRLFRKAMALLVFLFVESGRAHNRHFLSTLIWPERPDNRANNSLRQTLHLLRTTHSPQENTPIILATPGQVQLNPEAVREFDASGFFHPPPGCEIVHDPRECRSCREQLTRALQAIRGPVLDGFSFPECEELEYWVTGIREDLTARCRWALDRILVYLEEENRLREGILLLDRYLKLDPLDEERHRTLMTLLWKTGNRKAAERQFALCQKILKAELDVEPEPETQKLIEKIRSSASGPTQVVRTELVLQDSPLILEWHQATALYLDLLSPESFEAPLSSSSLLGTLLETIKEYGGDEWRIDEHGILALFGIDGETERATIRAAKAALEIGRIVNHRPDKISGQVIYRAGIHSGRILKHSRKNTPDPTGMVSRSAMSLCLQARPGTVLLSAESFRALRGQIASVGTETVSLFRRRTLGYILPVQSQIEPLKEDHPLIGRGEESRIFRELYSPDGGGYLLVKGEPGIGKSALVHSFLREAESRGAVIRVFECYPHTQNTPFYPFAQCIREVARIPMGSERETALSRLSDYIQILGLERDPHAQEVLQSLLSISELPGQDLSDAHLSNLGQKTFPLLRNLIKARARLSPIVFLTEDLQWIDPSTESLLKEALWDPSLGEKIFFILTARSGEVPSWVASVPGLQTIRLSPLPADEARELVRSLDGDRILPDKEVSRIIDMGDGVPLFLQELTRESLESSGTNKRLPSSIWEVLESRLGRLGESRPLISVAAVIGRKVPIDLLRILFPAPASAFNRLVQEAIRANLVRRSRDQSEKSGEALEFRHALIQEASLRSLPPPLLKDIHRKVAHGLCDHFPERARATPGIVALHYDQAGELQTAVSWYKKAGELSMWEGGMTEAEHAIRRALTLLSESPYDPGTETKEFRLKLLLGTLLIERDGQMYGREIVQNLGGSDSLPDPEDPLFQEKLASRYRYWESLFGGVDLRKVRMVTDTLFKLDECREHPILQAYCLFVHGNASFWEGHISETNRFMEQCLHLLDTLPLEDRTIHLEAFQFKAHQIYPWGLWFEGRFREVEDSLVALLNEAESSHYPPFAKPFLLTFVGFVYRYLRNFDETIRVCDLLLEASQAVEMKRWNPSERGLRGWAMVMKGDSKGLDLILESIPLSRKSHALAEIKYLSLLADAYLALGEFRKARGVTDSALRFSKKTGTAFFDAELHRLKGLAALSEGHRMEARRLFEQALAISRIQGARALALRAATSLGEIMIEEGDPKKAKKVFDGLEDLLEGPKTDPSLPDVREAQDIWKKISGKG